MTEQSCRRAIGLMSGTSMDGIDVALIETDGERLVRRGPSKVFPFEPGFRTRLSAALEEAKAIRERDERPGDTADVERHITDLHADAARQFLHEFGIDAASIDVIGFHGQTVLHRPADALTVQLGDGQGLADALGIPVVFDMRAADMRAGGQGAPLVPAYHAALGSTLPAGMNGLPTAFVNIGGISNITFLDGDAPPIAFDSGPGNALLDQWVMRGAGLAFDAQGAIAARGKIDPALAERYLSADFFTRPLPKSLDRFDFAVPEEAAGTLEDVARTLCFVAAESVLKASEHLPVPPALWLICGGGRHHPVIMQDLAAGAARVGARVASAEEAGLDGDAMEAEAWAYLAVRSLRGMPLTWPSTTGCSGPTTGGQLARPNLPAPMRRTA